MAVILIGYRGDNNAARRGRNAVKRAGLYAESLPAQLPIYPPVENNHRRNKDIVVQGYGK